MNESKEQSTDLDVTLYEGSCACGAVRLAIHSEPQGPFQCFCEQCRRASGGGPATFVIAPRNQVTIEGRMSAFSDPTASGKYASRKFCPECGTAVCSEPGENPDSLVIKLSMIRSHAWTSIAAIFWLSEKPEWAIAPPEAIQYETQP